MQLEALKGLCRHQRRVTQYVFLVGMEGIREVHRGEEEILSLAGGRGLMLIVDDFGARALVGALDVDARGTLYVLMHSHKVGSVALALDILDAGPYRLENGGVSLLRSEY